MKKGKILVGFILIKISSVVVLYWSCLEKFLVFFLVDSFFVSINEFNII